MVRFKRNLSMLTIVALLLGQLYSYAPEAMAKSNKVRLNKTKTTITVGKKVTLKLLNAKKKVTWVSSNKKIATVSSKGVVKGKKAGNTRIAAKCNKKKYVCKVTVKKRTAAQLIPKPTVVPTPGVEQVTVSQVENWNKDNKNFDIVRHEDGQISFISGKVSDGKVTNKDEAYEAVSALKNLDSSKDIKLCYLQTDTDLNGDIYYRFNQYVKGYLIPNHMVVLGTDAVGNTISYSNGILPDTKDIDAHDMITAEEALQAVKAVLPDFEEEPLQPPCIEVVDVYDIPSFSWAVYGKNSYNSNDEIIYPYIKVSVDAHSGTIFDVCEIPYLGDLSQEDAMGNSKAFKNITTEPMDFKDADGKTVTLPVAKTKDHKYYVVDIKRKIMTYNYIDALTCEMHRDLYTFEKAEDLSPNFVSELHNMIQVYDFYEKMGYKSTDGKGKNSISIYLGYRENGKEIENAAFLTSYGNESRFVFADYPGSITSLDVVAHEYAHSIHMNLVKNMEYAHLSGAMMESYADIIGNGLEMCVCDEKECDKELWGVGEVDAAHRESAFRFMGEPNAGEQPKYVGDVYWISDQYASYWDDYAGVHTNSSVLSYICYSLFKDKKIDFTYEDYFKIWFTTGYLTLNGTNYDDYRAYVKYSMNRHHSSGSNKAVDETFDEANTKDVDMSNWEYDLKEGYTYLQFEQAECKDDEFLAIMVYWDDYAHYVTASNQGDHMIAMVPKGKKYTVQYFLVSHNDISIDYMFYSDQISVGQESAKLAFDRDMIKPLYQRLSAWAYRPTDKELEAKASADVFFLNPTAVLGSASELNMEAYDLASRETFLSAVNMEKGIYDEDTHFFAPYYRQQTLAAYKLAEKQREAYKQLALEDVKRAFDFFMQKHEEGTPIILAGFSQGSELLKELLVMQKDNKDFMKDYLAAYAIGWSFTDEFLKENPEIKMAKGEKDTGVVVSFCTEAVDYNGSSVVYREGTHANGINPLNWKTDSTAADKAENKGACFMDGDGTVLSEVKGLCGAYLDPKRGTLKVTDIHTSDYPAVLDIFEDGNFHIYDYQFFYRNLQQNVKTRIANFN